MSQPMLPNVDQPEDQTFGDIVWIQFKKNRVAYFSLWGLGALFVLATIAPLIANGRPYVWDVGQGLEFPWLRSLFDRNYFENPVDIFFNMLLIMTIPIGGLALFRYRAIKNLGLDKRR